MDGSGSLASNYTANRMLLQGFIYLLAILFRACMTELCIQMPKKEMVEEETLPYSKNRERPTRNLASYN